jgi:hypothetical protein
LLVIEISFRRVIVPKHNSIEDGIERPKRMLPILFQSRLSSLTHDNNSELVEGEFVIVGAIVSGMDMDGDLVGGRVMIQAARSLFKTVTTFIYVTLVKLNPMPSLCPT